jgi:hypothetical protein
MTPDTSVHHLDFVNWIVNQTARVVVIESEALLVYLVT